MDLDDPKEILKVYREEVREISTRMTADLLAMEAPDAVPGPLLDRLFRDAHTIKGGAGSLGLEEVSQLAHAGESILGACKRGERAFDVASTDAFLAMLDAIGNRLDMRLAGREGCLDMNGRSASSIWVMRETITPCSTSTRCATMSWSDQPSGFGASRAEDGRPTSSERRTAGVRARTSSAIWSILGMSAVYYQPEQRAERWGCLRAENEAD